MWVEIVVVGHMHRVHEPKEFEPIRPSSVLPVHGFVPRLMTDLGFSSGSCTRCNALEQGCKVLDPRSSKA